MFIKNKKKIFHLPTHFFLRGERAIKLFFFRPWLITKNANIKSFVWATVTKLAMWVEVDPGKWTQVLPLCSVVVDAHIKYLICIFVLIG